MKKISQSCVAGDKPDSPESDEALQSWPQFTNEVRARLEMGKAEYGDASFRAPVEEIIVEIQQEFMDVAGWAFIGWQKLEDLKKNLASRGVVL